MQFMPGTTNHLRIGHQNYFFNFTEQNLAWCEGEVPLVLNEIIIFIHDTTISADMAALDALIEYRNGIVKRWRHPISIQLCGPHRHTLLRRWIEDYGNAHVGSITGVSAQNSFRTPVYVIPYRDSDTDGWLNIHYGCNQPDEWVMTVIYESRINDSKILLGSYPVKPSDDWIASRKPGYR